ncbi:cleavage and polyadenylation specificity factor subunit 1 isoform X2 [Cucumis melo var. makuwa]|uniref:Cleavage and polyadenylation specificity factor subunit 1 isoform X2 n=1 Tax=Cucumis melo var. makuwa TaxID=1194695 RepID=A0A5D3CBE7_CUCMM|nr:cleavage and polyadenylation specificity factor subunit 1 isoform X2 [Cucumis melo var. makuwa]
MIEEMTALDDNGKLGVKPCSTPMIPNLQLAKEGELFKDPERYKRLVGKLNYLIVTQPDIAYFVDENCLRRGEWWTALSNGEIAGDKEWQRQGERRRVIQVYESGARILDGSFMTQDLNLVVNGNESGNASEGCTVLSASISDPYVLLTMTDGSIRLLVGGKVGYIIKEKIAPNLNDVLFVAWDAENSIVTTCVVNSMVEDFNCNYICYSATKELGDSVT